MIAFALGAIAAYLLLYASAMAVGWTWLRAEPQAVSDYAILLVLLPSAGAYLAAELVHRLRPTRAFDLRTRMALGAATAGFLSGVLGAVMIAAAQIPRLELPDFLLCGASGFAAAIPAAWCLGRVRPGRCIHCDYDLTGAAGAKCPECGNVPSLRGRGVSML